MENENIYLGSRAEIRDLLVQLHAGLATIDQVADTLHWSQRWVERQAQSRGRVAALIEYQDRREKATIRIREIAHSK